MFEITDTENTRLNGARIKVVGVGGGGVAGRCGVNGFLDVGCAVRAQVHDQGAIGLGFVVRGLGGVAFDVGHVVSCRYGLHCCVAVGFGKQGGRGG